MEPARAYGYVRFSSDRQEHGDSVRRQTEGVVEWLSRNAERFRLDRSLGENGFFIDRGKTGFAPTGERRDNLEDAYALGEFLKLLRGKRIPRGSALVVESADRLSRESPVVALNLLTQLLLEGAVVVTLSPPMEYRTDADIGKLITAGVTIGRAHDESQMKHRRNSWPVKRAAAKEGKPLTSNLPSWCKLVGAERVGTRLVGGSIKLDPVKARAARRAFDLVLGGETAVRAAGILNAKNVPAPRGPRWTLSAVYNLVTNPALIGEFHPHTGTHGNTAKGRPNTRKPTGEVVRDYYPRLVTDEEFRTVAGLLAQRSHFRGRRGKHLNLLSGLLRCARSGTAVGYKRPPNRPAQLVPLGSIDGTGRSHGTFNAVAFERLLLERLRELKASDLAPEDAASNDAARLAALHAAKEGEILDLVRQIDADTKLMARFRPTLARLEGEAEQLARELAEAQRLAASPAAEVLGEAQTAAHLLDRDPDNDAVRTRCRNALRRLIESVHVVFVGSKCTRVAAARVQFRGSDAHRDYVMLTFSANRTRRKPPAPQARAARWDGKDGPLDLRKPADLEQVVKLLTAIHDEVRLAKLKQKPTRNPGSRPAAAIETRREKVRELRAGGLSVRAIAAKLRVSKDVVHRDLQRTSRTG